MHIGGSCALEVEWNRGMGRRGTGFLTLEYKQHINDKPAYTVYKNWSEVEINPFSILRKGCQFDFIITNAVVCTAVIH